MIAGLTFEVHGLPQPQGSAKGFVHRSTGRVIVTSDNPQLRSWRQDVAARASEALGDLPRPLYRRGQPVRLAVTFYLPRPQSAPRRVLYPATRPDLDKLLRALCDALSGLAFEDDAMVVTAIVEKRFGTPGAVVGVGLLDEAPPPPGGDQEGPGHEPQRDLFRNGR